MSIFDIGKSWEGIIINPIGYALTRTSLSDAANKYHQQNPPVGCNGGLVGNDTKVYTPEEFEELRDTWGNSCAAKLKGDDVGKSKANSLASCLSVFDGDPCVQTAYSNVQDQQQASNVALQGNVKNLMILLFIILFIAAIGWLLISK